MATMRHPLTFLQENFYKLLHSKFGSLEQEAYHLAGGWVPNVDIKETTTNYIVLADLPGVDPKDVKVSFDNNCLILQGERNEQQKTEKDNYTREERFFGKFYRKFIFSDNVDGEDIKATGKNGVLVVTIPKNESKTTKMIEVNIE